VLGVLAELYCWYVPLNYLIFSVVARFSFMKWAPDQYLGWPQSNRYKNNFQLTILSMCNSIFLTCASSVTSTSGVSCDQIWIMWPGLNHVTWFESCDLVWIMWPTHQAVRILLQWKWLHICTRDLLSTRSSWSAQLKNTGGNHIPPTAPISHPLRKILPLDW